MSFYSAKDARGHHPGVIDDAMGWYERLSAQDASFLVYEDRDASAHMHVGGVSVYEAGPLSNPRGGVDERRSAATSPRACT